MDAEQTRNSGHTDTTGSFDSGGTDPEGHERTSEADGEGRGADLGSILADIGATWREIVREGAAANDLQQWLSANEAAEVRGVTPRHFRRQAKREGLPTRLSNAGVTLFLVPVETIEGEASPVPRRCPYCRQPAGLEGEAPRGVARIVLALGIVRTAVHLTHGRDNVVAELLQAAANDDPVVEQTPHASRPCPFCGTAMPTALRRTAVYTDGLARVLGGLRPVLEMISERRALPDEASEDDSIVVEPEEPDEQTAWDEAEAHPPRRRLRWFGRRRR